MPWCAMKVSFPKRVQPVLRADRRTAACPARDVPRRSAVASPGPRGDAAGNAGSSVMDWLGAGLMQASAPTRSRRSSRFVLVSGAAEMRRRVAGGRGDVLVHVLDDLETEAGNGMEAFRRAQHPHPAHAEIGEDLRSEPHRAQIGPAVVLGERFAVILAAVGIDPRDDLVRRLRRPQHDHDSAAFLCDAAQRIPRPAIPRPVAGWR